MHEHGGNLTPYLRKNQPESWIDFSANINCLGMPETVKHAAVQGVLDSFHYPDPGCNRLVESISQSLSVNKNWILCGNGAAELIYDALRVLSPRKALVAAPGFFEYEQALRSINCEIVYASLQEKEGFLVTSSFLETLQETPGVELVILTNPNNPTGRLIPPETLKRILEVCQKKGIWFLLDECFLDFLPDGDAYTMMRELGGAENLFILKAFTKLYGMAGVRLGYGFCADETLLARMRNAGQPWAVSSLAQAGGVAALEQTEYVEQVRLLIEKERPYLQAGLQALGLRVISGKANYLLFRATRTLGEEMERRGVVLRGCGNYPGLDDTWYRTAVRTRRENDILLQTLREVLG